MVPLERALRGAGRCTGGRGCGCALDGLVGHHACCKLLLGLLKTGTCGAIQSMHLLEHDERDDGGGREERRYEDHHDAHRDAPVEAREGGDPTAISPIMKSCSLQHMHSELTDVDEEEHEESE